MLRTPRYARAATAETAEDINEWTKHGKGYVPKNGFIPDKGTAIKVAEAILTATYGEHQIAQERPLKVALVDNDIWLIWGTMPENAVGGTAIIKLSKRTGGVLYLAHAE